MKTTTPLPAVKKSRVDGQMTGLSGELFVAAELLKRGLQASITFGNAKQIDLFAHNPETGADFNIQVKSLRYINWFPIKTIQAKRTYVFVVLNKPGELVKDYIVQGQRIMNEPQRFPTLDDPKFPCVHPKQLADFENAWSVFGCK